MESKDALFYGTLVVIVFIIVLQLIVYMLLRKDILNPNYSVQTALIGITVFLSLTVGGAVFAVHYMNSNPTSFA